MLGFALKYPEGVQAFERHAMPDILMVDDDGQRVACPEDERENGQAAMLIAYKLGWPLTDDRGMPLVIRTPANNSLDEPVPFVPADDRSNVWVGGFTAVEGHRYPSLAFTTREHAEKYAASAGTTNFDWIEEYAPVPF